ncbi:MAG: hypothetical protein Q4P13_05555 [Psychrobacter sp.]|nr:hypothetical protein [Psychrobacter sp.]
MRYFQGFSQLAARALLPTLAMGALTLSACTTTTSPQLRQNLDNTQQKLRAAPVSVIADACLLRLEVGTSHVLFEQSQAFANAVALDVRQQLAARGISAKSQNVPFICGSLPEKDVTRYDIKLTAEGERQQLTVYPLKSATNQLDATTNSAYLTLLQSLPTLKARDKDLPLTLTLDAVTQQHLQSHLGSQYVFVIESAGGKKSFGRGMLEGVASTAVLMAAGANMYAVPQDGARYSIYLIDLKANQLLWFKRNQSVDPTVFKAPVDSYTTPKLLTPLYTD